MSTALIRSIQYLITIVRLYWEPANTYGTEKEIYIIPTELKPLLSFIITIKLTLLSSAGTIATEIITNRLRCTMI